MLLSREEIYTRLNDVFRDVFDDASISVSDSTTAADLEEWDSFNHVTLIVAIEKEFGIKFSMIEVTNMYNVGEIVDIIESKHHNG
ncbi:MAG: acyl carrier protein [Rickettsiales bacterium]|jgi:acyl carrier protein|nr:acyl carrier protein [Rickettsiales bacterium]